MQLTLDSANPNLYKRTEEDLVDRAIWPEPIAGPDGALFEYSIPDRRYRSQAPLQGCARLRKPDGREPRQRVRGDDNESDGDGAMGTKSVRVTVMNVDEKGKLVLSPEQPDDGMPVIATVTDPDPRRYRGVIVPTGEWAAATSPLRSFPDSPDEGRRVMPTTTVNAWRATGWYGIHGQTSICPRLRFVWAMVELPRRRSIVERRPGHRS